MKIYNKHNFFKHTYCEFLISETTVFTKNKPHHTSKKGSRYLYTEEGVYRHSNHWGRVADCRWKLNQEEEYKNQRYVIGFAKWTDFYPLNTTDRTFYITVDFDTNNTQIHHIKNKEKEGFFLFSLSDVQKRKKQIYHLLTTNKWAKYYTQPIDVLRKVIVSELISSNKTLQEVKKEQK